MGKTAFIQASAAPSQSENRDYDKYLGTVTTNASQGGKW